MTWVIVVLIAFAAFCFGIAVGEIVATAIRYRPARPRRVTLVYIDEHSAVVTERPSLLQQEGSWN